MKVVKIITLILNLFVFIYSLYFIIFGILPLFKKKKKEKTFDAKHRFRIIIAARNEELVIPDLIDSLKKQDYPKDMYDIYVAPNNCTDNTKKVSLEHGAKIIDIKVPVKSKGEVLNYIYKKFRNDKSFDTYVIFDADNVVDKNFLKEMNNKLLNGYEVAQGFRDCKNLYDNWLSGSYAISYYLQHLFLYETREKLGASASINGTGYVITKKALEKLNYKATTLTEDIELNTVCAINNQKIGYASKAILYDEQVAKFGSSIKQRNRWNRGFLQILKGYLKDLVTCFKKHHTLIAIDNIVLIFGPIYQVLLVIVTIMNIIVTNNILITLLFGVVSYLASVLLALFLCIYYKKKIIPLLPAIFLFSIFLVSGIISSIIALIKPSGEWEEIKHIKRANIEEIVKNN